MLRVACNRVEWRECALTDQTLGYVDGLAVGLVVDGDHGHNELLAATLACLALLLRGA